MGNLTYDMWKAVSLQRAEIIDAYHAMGTFELTTGEYNNPHQDAYLADAEYNRCRKILRYLGRRLNREV